MGIVLAVKKKNVICIAADTMTVSGGSRKQTASYVDNSEKIIKCGTSYIGTADHPTWKLTIERYLGGLKHKPTFSSQEEIFTELLKMHKALKDKYFLSSNEGEEPFESSRFESLIVNPHGIFKTCKLRSIQEFIQFSAIGSGASYALGALHALYDQLDSAEEIAKAALSMVTEFDDSSGLSGTFYIIKKPK